MLFIIAIGLIWLVGACIRVYQQARFYQIEEYMSLRYLRWLFAERGRWLPARGTAAGIGGAIAALFTGDTDFVTFGIVTVAAIVGSWPQPQGEVKKGFIRTKRATRLLGAAFAVALVLVMLVTLITVQIPDIELAMVATHLLGFLVWWSAPLLLTLGNALMIPVEANIRNGFKRQARQKLDRVQPKVIGITGSYGKTSTKTYIAHLLNGKYKAFPTPKSWNTIMGVCLAINTRLSDDTEYFICEMGAYVRGEIQEISALTHPTISVVVEVGPQHLERFGSLENIAIAKYEIIKALPPDGVGVFNWDNPHVRAMAERGYPQTRLTVSRTADPTTPTPDGPRFIASDEIETLDGLSFTVTDTQTGESERLETPLVGQHNVTNILLAAAIAVHEGMTLAEIAKRARTMQPAEARLVRNVLPNGMTIINDAYSANPVGAVSSLRVLGMHDTGRRLLITPGMVELGDLNDTENRKLGEAAANYATDIILVGEEQTRPIHEGLTSIGFPVERLMVMDTVTEAIEWYQQHLGAGDTILFLNDLPDTY
jgi:UDP-N-acetylmuramoyl-tripeptide--D-alanyl-D-alanine ligase